MLGIFGFLSFSNARLYQRRMDLSNQAGTLQNEVDRLDQDNKKLHNRLEQAGTQEYLEKTARERLNLKKPGEEVVAVIAPRETGEEQEKSAEKNPWQKIFKKIESFMRAFASP